MFVLGGEGGGRHPLTGHRKGSAGPATGKGGARARVHLTAPVSAPRLLILLPASCLVPGHRQAWLLASRDMLARWGKVS